jgi:small subunit ribosomal protein S12
MSRIKQLLKLKYNKRKKKVFNGITKKSLEKCPQKKGVCTKVFVRSPKKPNSASRKVAKVLLTSTKKQVICHIPGIGHTLQKYSNVLVRGGRVKDLPGVKFRLIRGKFDLRAVLDRRNARSKYGKKKSERR